MLLFALLLFKSGLVRLLLSELVGEAEASSSSSSMYSLVSLASSVDSFTGLNGLLDFDFFFLALLLSALALRCALVEDILLYTGERDRKC